MLSLAFLAASPALANPDIVLILADDFGVNDARNAGIPTPNLTALAARGVTFTTAYAAAPVCGPSRAKMLAGRWRATPDANQGSTPDSVWGVPAGTWQLADGMRAAGYTTHHIGKSHSGANPWQHPHELGFDHFFGFRAGEHPYTGGAPLESDSQSVPLTGYSTDVFANAAIEALRRPGPDFVYLAMNAPHTPIVTSYRAMVTKLDAAVGQIMAAAPDALIAFAGDHGPDTGDSGATAKPLRGSKRSFYDGGLRVPLVIAGPGFTGGRKDARVSSLLDLAPTLLRAAGGVVPGNLDGINLASAQKHECLAWGPPKADYIRCGAWKLVNGDLFNLSTDPGERRPVTNAAKVAELRTKRAAMVR